MIPALAMEMGIRSYLELGCHENETVGAMPDAMGEAGRIFAVDLVEPAERVKGVEYRIMSTGEYFDAWAKDDAPFDMVFIDADHSARSALLDFESVWPYVTEEGLILLHDTNPELLADTAPGYCGNSWEVAKYLHKIEHECLTLPYHPGLTIVRKRVSWGPTDGLKEEIPGLTPGKEPYASVS